MLGSFLLAWGSVEAARLMHQDLLSNVLRLPQAFFDTVPGGRILNRFSKDVDTVDVLLPGSFSSMLSTLLSVRRACPLAVDLTI